LFGHSNSWAMPFALLFAQTMLPRKARNAIQLWYFSWVWLLTLS
jgi:hypothetical protein